LKSSYVGDKPTLIYDGICNLCTTAVRFLYALDRGWRLEYLPSQELSQPLRDRYGLTQDRLQGQMRLIGRDGSIISGAVAIKEICKLIVPFGFVCNSFGARQAQQLYDWIARRRYRLFGCRGTCYVVYLLHSKRFD
jgi:predicted DCC family thiol-disulfide oxidoreductase YuxK